MDMLAKMKLLEKQLDDPEFRKKFDERFEEFSKEWDERESMINNDIVFSQVIVKSPKIISNTNFDSKVNFRQEKSKKIVEKDGYYASQTCAAAA